jgi:hypothetical protein
VLSRDGSLAATGCEDGRIRLFAVVTGVAISELRYPGKLARLASFPEGAVLLAGGGNGLRGFLVSGDDLMQEACSRVSRNLTFAEWQRDVGARACRPPARACPPADDAQGSWFESDGSFQTVLACANHASARFLL